MRSFAAGHFVQKVVAAAEIFPATKSVMRFPKLLTAFAVGLLNLSLLTRFWKRGEQAKLLTHKGHLENGIINMHKTG